MPFLPTAEPQLTLRTLTRGDGLLGLRPRVPLGPRGEQVTVATLAARDADAEQTLLKLGLVALDPALLQWRGAAPSLGGASLWTTVQEEFFGDFHADKVPELRALGWQVTTEPGFAHHSKFVFAQAVVKASTIPRGSLRTAKAFGGGATPAPCAVRPTPSNRLAA